MWLHYAPRLSEVVGETSTGEADGDFGVHADGTADGGDEGARRREVRDELLGVLAIVRETVTATNTIITRGEHDGATAGTELREEAADLDSVVLGNGLLVVTVTGSELYGAVSIQKGNV